MPLFFITSSRRSRKLWSRFKPRQCTHTQYQLECEPIIHPHYGGARKENPLNNFGDETLAGILSFNARCSEARAFSNSLTTYLWLPSRLKQRRLINLSTIHGRGEGGQTGVLGRVTWSELAVRLYKGSQERKKRQIIIWIIHIKWKKERSLYVNIHMCNISY
jgi:hypothetical protein